MTDNSHTFNRRKVLSYLGTAGAVGLAGCGGDGGDGGGDGGDGGGDGGDGGGDSGSDGGDGGSDGGDGGSDGGDGGGGGQILLQTAGGSPGGVGYAIMNATLSSASAEHQNVAYNILPGGWVGNNTRLQNKEIDVGHTTLAAGTLAYNLTDPYNDKDWNQPPSNIRSILADQSEIFFFVVTQPDFPYDSLEAAANDDYAISVTNQPEGTFGGFLWDTVLAELDYGQQQIQDLGGSYRRVGWNDAAQLFSDGQVDAILAVGGRDLGWLNSIAANQDVNYLSWQDEFRSQISESYGVLQVELDAGVFPQQDEPLRCTQDSGLINTHVDVSEEAIYLVTDGIIKREQQIRESTGLLEPFEASSAMVDPVPFDLHPGAQRAYEEHDIL
ncbi:MAG: TAXI family TRAP transporter solute-binding subunit [Halolamina sp.]